MNKETIEAYISQGKILFGEYLRTSNGVEVKSGMFTGYMLAGEVLGVFDEEHTDERMMRCVLLSQEVIGGALTLRQAVISYENYLYIECFKLEDKISYEEAKKMAMENQHVKDLEVFNDIA